MTLSLRKNLCLRIISRSFTLNSNSITANFRLSSSTKNMNTLQEASTIYKAFKNGGPAFGGWQVREPILLWISIVLTLTYRCYLGQITLELLPVLVLIGSAWTVNMVTLTVCFGAVRGTIGADQILTLIRRRNARSYHCHSTRRCQSYRPHTRQRGLDGQE